MPVLHFGVIDVPYQYARPQRVRHARKGKAARPRNAAKYTQTTHDVACILEAKYHVMAVFERIYGKKIADFMADDITKALKNIRAGMPKELIQRSMLMESMDQIADAYRKFLYTGEAERVGIRGTPTQASIDRRSMRFKTKINPNGRPSFIDTGLYERSFRAWVADK